MKTEAVVMKIQCTIENVGKDILIPIDERSQKAVQSIGYGIPIHIIATHTEDHNIERHRLFWACCGIVVENMENTKIPHTPETIAEAVKIDARHYSGFTVYNDKNGKQRINVITKSISFSAMTKQEANEFYSKAFDILAGYIDIETGSLIEQAKLQMKTRKICSICGKRAVHKHHKFSRTKWAIERYGKDAVDADFNIEWLCPDCHSSHAKIPVELTWNESTFLREREKNIAKTNKNNIKNVFIGG